MQVGRALLAWKVIAIGILHFSIQLRAETFVIPHFATGPVTIAVSFNTTLTVVNPTASEIEILVEGFGSTGDKIDLGPRGVTKVPPQATVQVSIFSENFQSGWLRITSSGAAVVRGSAALFLISPTGVPPSPCGFPPLATVDADPTESFREAWVPVSFHGLCGSTGIALSFPSSGNIEAVANLTLTDSAGRQVGSTGVIIPANGQRLFLIEEMFPQVRTLRGAVYTLKAKSASLLHGVAVAFRQGVDWKTFEFAKHPGS